MIWAQLLAYVTGTVNQELLVRNEYLAAENRILKAQTMGAKVPAIYVESADEPFPPATQSASS